MRGIVRMLSVVLVTAVLLVAGLVGRAVPAVAVGPTADDPVGAAELLALANVERAAAGLPLLVPRDDVTAIAFEHSRRMAEADDLWHNDAYFTSSSKARLGARSLGENVAENRSMADAHRRLLLSDGHRANLLDPKFTVVGFAVVRAASGLGYVTQAFVEPLPGTAPPPIAPLAAADEAAPAPVPSPPAPAPTPPPAPAPAPAPRPAVATAAPPAPVERPSASLPPATSPATAAAAVAPDPELAPAERAPVAQPAPSPRPASDGGPSGELAAGPLTRPGARATAVPLLLVLLAVAALAADVALLARRRLRGGHRLGG